MTDSLVTSVTSAFAENPEASDLTDALDDYILFTNAEGIVIGTNPKAETYFTGKAAGQPFWELYGLNVANMQEALHTFCPETTYEVEGRQSKGSFSLRIVSIPQSIAPQGGYVIVATDVHPIKEIQEQYEDNLVAWDDTVALLNSLFESAKDPIMLVRSDCTVVTANKRASTLFSDSSTSLANQDVRAFISEESLPLFEEDFQKVPPNTPWTRNLTVLTIGGTVLPVEAVMRRVTLSSFSLMQIAMRDVSQRVQLQEDLELMTTEVEDMSTTLKQVIRSVEEEKQEMKEELAQQVMEQVLPALDRIAEEDSSDVRQSYKSVIEDQISEFVDGTSTALDSVMLKLTPREIEICRLITLGRKSRDIAELLAISFETLQTHRKNIRRKLNLKGSRISLFSFLQQSDLST